MEVSLSRSETKGKPCVPLLRSRKRLPLRWCSYQNSGLVTLESSSNCATRETNLFRLTRVSPSWMLRLNEKDVLGLTLNGFAERTNNWREMH